MTLVRTAALGFLLALPLSSLAQTPWNPFWSIPSLPKANAGPLAVGTVGESSSGYAVDLQNHTLVAYDLASGGARWSVPLKAEAEYSPSVAIGSGYIAVVRSDTLEVRRLQDGSLVRTLLLDSTGPNGFAIHGDRINVGSKVYTWPDLQPTGEPTIQLAINYNGVFSPDGRYYAKQGSYEETATGKSWPLGGDEGRFSADSKIVYSYVRDTNNLQGTVFAVNTADGSLRWSFESSKILLYSALPLANGYVVATGQYRKFGSQPGGDVFVILNGKTGKLVSLLQNPDSVSATYHISQVVATSPTGGRAIIVAPAQGTKSSRILEVDANGVATLQPVALLDTGNGVEFGGERAVVYAGTQEVIGESPISTVYKPNGTIAWQGELYSRGPWPWLDQSVHYGGSFTPDGNFGATIRTVPAFARTFNGVKGSPLALTESNETVSTFLFGLDEGNAVGKAAFTANRAVYYQRVGHSLKTVGILDNALPMGTNIGGKRFVVLRPQGVIEIYRSSDGRLLTTVPAELEPSDNPRAFLDGDTLTTLTVTRPEGFLARVTAMVWNLGGKTPTKVRTVTRDLPKSDSSEGLYGVAATLSPDGRQMLLQFRTSGPNPRRSLELVRMADGNTIAHLTPTNSGDPALDIAISESGSRAILALANGTKDIMAMPAVVDSISARAVTRKQALVTVRLMAPAPLGGAPVRFRFTPDIATPPATAVIPAGASSATFRIGLETVTTDTDLLIEAAVAEEDWASTTLTLSP